MDSLMSIDNSDYAAEVRQINDQNEPSPSLLRQQPQTAGLLAIPRESAASYPYQDGSLMQIDGPSYQDQPRSSPSPLGKRSRAQFERDSDAEIAIGSSTPKIDNKLSSPSQRRSLRQSGGKRFSPSRRVHVARPARVEYRVLPAVALGLRRVGGTIASLWGKVWGFVKTRYEAATEIVALEVDESGRKRRAVAQIPASWPDSPVSVSNTLPQSRREPVMEQKQFGASTRTRIARVQKFPAAKMISEPNKGRKPEEQNLRYMSGPDRIAMIQRRKAARAKKQGIEIEPETEPEDSAEKDAVVDALTERAKAITLSARPEVEEAVPEPEPEPVKEEEKKVLDLIQPISDDWADKIDTAMSNKNQDKVLAQTAEGVGLTVRDFATVCARPGQKKASAWLNDEMVNGFFAAIVSRKKEQANWTKGSPAPYATFPSGWYNNVSKKGLTSIKRWSRPRGIQKAQLLEAEKVFLPINTGNHWMLCIISPQDKTIEVLDSLLGKNTRIYALARDWLQQELEDLYIAADWKEVANLSSMQDNSDDCGVFTCFNGLAAAEGVPYEQVTAEKMQDARRRMGAILLNEGFHGDFAL